MLQKFFIVFAMLALCISCKSKVTGQHNIPTDDSTPPGDSAMGDSGGPGDTGPQNAAPVAIISPASSTEVRKGTTQALDGSASTDADGTIAGYAWTLPVGYAAADLGLTDPELTNVSITVTAPATVPADPNLVFTLTVTDDDGATNSASATLVVVENEAPVAVVTPAAPIEVREGADLTLDASGSTDDIAVASFTWTLPVGYSEADLGVSAADLTTATLPFTAPFVAADTDLTFVLTITDNEGRSTVVQIVVTIVANHPPVAVIDPAGPLTVRRNLVVQLNGSPSYDDDGTIVSYAWTLPGASVPADFGLTVGDLTHAGITPRAPNAVPASALVFTLTVTDNEGDSGQATVSITVANGAPVVRLFGVTGDQALSVSRGDWNTLDFSASSDPDDDPLTFTYGGQIGTGGACVGATNFNFSNLGDSAAFGIPKNPATGACQGDGPFTLTITANDGLVNSATMTVAVSVINSPPVVHITGPATVAAGAGGTVNGSTTTDPDPGDTVTYAWTVRSASDPLASCAADWGVGALNLSTVTFTAPTTATNPECAAGAVFWLTATDDNVPTAGVGMGGFTVTVGTVSGTHTLTTYDVSIAEGHTTLAYASVSPTLLGTDTYAYNWTKAYVSGPCAALDLTLGNPWTNPPFDFTTASYRGLAVAGDKVGCVFDVTVTLNINAGAEILVSTFRVTTTNLAPTITVPGVPETSPGVFEITYPPGGSPVLTAVAGDPDGITASAPLTYTWSGDTSAVACNPTCPSGSITNPAGGTLRLTFSSPTVAGTTYTFDLLVSDGVASASASILVHVEPCLYAGKTVTDPGAVLGTRANPHLTVQAAVDAAITSANTNVCVLTGTYTENLLVKASVTNTPMISGGYDASTGQPLTTGRRDASIIESIDADGVTFEPGSANALEFLTLTQNAALFAPAAAATVTISDASPTFYNVVIRGGAGDPAEAIVIVAGLGDAEPAFRTVDITGSSRTVATDVNAVRVSAALGRQAIPLFEDSQIHIGNGTGAGAGFAIEAGADALVYRVTIDDSVGLSASGLTEVTGIDVRGVIGRSATLLLADSDISFHSARNAGDVFGVRLAHSDNVEVSGTQISGSVGGRAGFGIADGNVHANGTIVAGASQNLSLHDNPSIAGMGPWSFSACSGTRFAVGVLLVGTSHVQITDNPGTTSDRGLSGIAGGRANFQVDWSTDRLPPTVAGLWLIDATDVTVLHSNILNGTMGGNDLCTKPSPYPITNALLDGLPAGLSQPAGHATTGLSVDRSVVQCSLMAENGSGGGGMFTWCVAADMQGALDATLTNNILASLSANVNVGLRLSGGTSLSVVNNLLDSDFFLMGAPPPPGSVWKYPLLADHVTAGALEMYNNILHTHRDDPYDNVNERLGVLELVTGGTSSHVSVFDHNLLFIEGDLVASTNVPPYYRIRTDLLTAADHPAADINAIPGIATNSGNRIADPLLVRDNDPFSGKGQVRLGPGSPALNVGLDSVAPDHDIDNEARTTGVEIGPDEVLP
jgi:hypothetical protein